MRLASKRVLSTEQGVHRPSSSGPQPASSGPTSTRGTKCLEIVSFRPDKTSLDHGGPGLQLQIFASPGRGSSPNASQVHGMEPFTCRCISKPPVQLWKETVPTQRQVPPSKAEHTRHEFFSTRGRRVAGKGSVASANPTACGTPEVDEKEAAAAAAAVAAKPIRRREVCRDSPLLGVAVEWFRWRPVMSLWTQPNSFYAPGEAA